MKRDSTELSNLSSSSNSSFNYSKHPLLPMLIHQILVSPLEENSQILLKGEYQIASVSHDYDLKHK